MELGPHKDRENPGQSFSLSLCGPSVGLTPTWFIWDRNLALHVTLHSPQLILISSFFEIHFKIKTSDKIGTGPHKDREKL